MSKSFDVLMQELNELQVEAQKVRVQGDAYYELAGSPAYPKDAIKDKYAYEQYKLCAKKFNSLNKKIQKLRSKLSTM